MRRPVAVLIAVLFLVAGCSSTTDISVNAGSATVHVGDHLHVTFGQVNASIGDGWFLTTPPDSAVLTDGGYESAGCASAGCGAEAWWNFTAASAGTTTAVFQYCYRSRPPNCEPGPGAGPNEPVKLAITVSA